MAAGKLSSITSLGDPILATIVNDVYTYKEFLLLFEKYCPLFRERLRDDRVKSVSLILWCFF